MPPSRLQRVLVTGATGALGPDLVSGLWDAGYFVRTLSLDEPEQGLFPNNTQIQIGDITHAETVKDAMKDVSLVFHLAALLHIPNPSPLQEKEFTRINVDGTRTVVDAAIESGVQRLVFFSTISVYGSSHGKVLDESFPPHPDTSYSKTKLSAEQLILNSRNNKNQPLGVILRYGAVYGARVKGNYRRLVHSLDSHRFIPIGKGKNRRTLIYVKDAAAAAILAAEHPAAAGKIFNVSDGQFHTVKEIIEAICYALERNPPKLYLPYRPVIIAASIAERTAGVLGRKSPGIKNAIHKYCEDIAVESHRISQELGFRPEYDLMAGWEETAEKSR